jgi:hypothetical protein
VGSLVGATRASSPQVVPEPDVTTLLVYPITHDGSLASAWRHRLYLYRSVFDKVAPAAIPSRSSGGSQQLGQGTVVPDVHDEVLAAPTAPYAEAGNQSTVPGLVTGSG